MTCRRKRVCPVKKAGSLDSRIRRLFQKPYKILRPYVAEGMTVLDIGCGPGFFTVDIARMVGATGSVIACDLQEGMLQKLGRKIRGTELEGRITLHQCKPDHIGVSVTVDFVLAFYVLHEVPDPDRLFGEMASILQPKGRMLIAEPPFHVSRREFGETIRSAGVFGLLPVDRPRVFLGRTVLLEKR